jgi:hypothetical protein
MVSRVRHLSAWPAFENGTGPENITGLRRFAIGVLKNYGNARVLQRKCAV